MTVHHIATNQDTMLRQRAMPITVFDRQLSKLAKDMMDTMMASDGVGIAAPQIYCPLALFIIASRPNARYPDAPLMAPQIMINPGIIAASAEQVMGEEGCLSLPGTRLSVPRHQWLEVEYQDLQGQRHQQVVDGFVARIFQHELDHLKGLTLLERIRLNEQTQESTLC
ncbi:MAG: peptide deformylase [Shewanella sp.]|nr:peptide deformylase [Shewanella sp.]MCF1430035.1 peptide deformylase [Shewanella sp.]MCF1438660.1 peptide deformylase [Shewanella sp.]MCF1458872.1 peptide deformylase [Shewanella sp.]